MIRTNDLLKNVLVDIEEGIRNGINTDIIAKKIPFHQSIYKDCSKSHSNSLLGLTYVPAN
jgi:hypothetical protein